MIPTLLQSKDSKRQATNFGNEPAPRVKEKVFEEIELTEGEDYRNLEGRLV